MALGAKIWEALGSKFWEVCSRQVGRCGGEDRCGGHRGGEDRCGGEFVVVVEV